MGWKNEVGDNINVYGPKIVKKQKLDGVGNYLVTLEDGTTRKLLNQESDSNWKANESPNPRMGESKAREWLDSMDGDPITQPEAEQIENELNEMRNKYLKDPKFKEYSDEMSKYYEGPGLERLISEEQNAELQRKFPEKVIAVDPNTTKYDEYIVIEEMQKKKKGQ